MCNRCAAPAKLPTFLVSPDVPDVIQKGLEQYWVQIFTNRFGVVIDNENTNAKKKKKKVSVTPTSVGYSGKGKEKKKKNTKKKNPPRCRPKQDKRPTFFSLPSLTSLITSFWINTHAHTPMRNISQGHPNGLYSDWAGVTHILIKHTHLQAA